MGGVKVGRREGSVVDGEPTTTPLDKLAEEERRTKECGREGGGSLQANYYLPELDQLLHKILPLSPHISEAFSLFLPID